MMNNLSTASDCSRTILYAPTVKTIPLEHYQRIYSTKNYQTLSILSKH